MFDAKRLLDQFMGGGQPDGDQGVGGDFLSGAGGGALRVAWRPCCWAARPVARSAARR